jgi:hypothetical protein
VDGASFALVTNALPKRYKKVFVFIGLLPDRKSFYRNHGLEFLPNF